MKNAKKVISKSDIFSWWKLATEKGRQTWHIDLPNEFNEIDWSSEDGKELLKEIDNAFYFDKRINPNPQDLVFRSQVNFSNKEKPNTAKEALQNGWHFFASLLSSDGHFPGDYGGPHFLLPGFVIACYITQIPIEEPYRTLVIRYMLNHQNADGGWGLHLEGKSTMFGTCLQYVSLRLLGTPAYHPPMVNARSWILKHGGALQLPPWGKFYLSCLGIYEWEGNHSLFPEMWFLPKWLPFHPSRYWCHARMVYLPMSYCFGVKIKAKKTDLLEALKNEIYTTPYETINWKAARDLCAATDVYHPSHSALGWLNAASNFYEKVKIKSLRNKALDFVIDYINAEDAQTNFIDIGPVNKVLNMLCVWHRYGADSILFLSHKQRLKDYLWLSEDGMKMQGYNGAQFWDTAFAFQALSFWKNSDEFEQAKSSMFSFIETQQVLEEPPKHKEFFRHSSVGGFPFSTKAHGWPITDCTAEGLKILLSNENKVAHWEARCQKSAMLLLSFQNSDGGWASYEKQRAPAWIEALNPSQVFGNIMVDYSYTECSSAALQALILFYEVFPNFKSKEVIQAIQKGLRFVLSQQREDGSWYGSWAVCFTYGTWFGVEVLSKAIGKNFIDEKVLLDALNKAGIFLMSKQREDGGWGEDFESCVQKKYIESKQSQVVNTAWAVLALLKIGNAETAVKRGIDFLVSKQLPNGEWHQEQVSGVFNHNCAISYTNYRNIFPLWALGEYNSRLN
jgi:lanosterol synthase